MAVAIRENICGCPRLELFEKGTGVRGEVNEEVEFAADKIGARQVADANVEFVFARRFVCVYTEPIEFADDEGGELGDDADPEPGRFIATGGIVIYNHAIEIRDRGSLPARYS